MKMYRVSEKYNFEFKYTYSQTRADASLTAPPLLLTLTLASNTLFSHA